MSLVSPDGPRGEAILQPAYFTSSVFVDALRLDISALVLGCQERLTGEVIVQPFAIFKDFWSSQGWPWLHFMVFDSRTRQVLLSSVLRVFLEYVISGETLDLRAIALFSFYTFFYTQPKDTAPPLYTVAHVAIPLDHYQSLLALPSLFNAETLTTFKAPVSWIISTFQRDQVFFLVPVSDLGPLNPRNLPRECLVDEKSVFPVIQDEPKKKGRPSRMDQSKKAKLAVENLHSWLDVTTAPTRAEPSHPLAPSLTQYQEVKSSLLQYIAAQAQSGLSDAQAAVERANIFVLEKLKVAGQLEGQANLTPPKTDEPASILRLERAVECLIRPTESNWRGGALGLLDGAGLT